MSNHVFNSRVYHKMSREAEKQAAAKTALGLEEVKKSRILGVGTGSTVQYFIENLPPQYIDDKVFVASSIDTAYMLAKRGARVLDPLTVDEIEVYVDGADAVDSDGDLIKGGGAALLKEKILARNSDSFIVIVDRSKLIEDLRAYPIPLEIIPSSMPRVVRWLADMKLNPMVRRCGSGKWGFVVTENGNLIIDIDAREWRGGLEELDISMKRITGVVETGLFIGMSDIIVVGGENTYVRRLR
jgi:ribose 5-phosphate isomerase A